ncbi:hypothetical protein LB467_05195 [Salegentibacter sp. JZCK2]|uniref:hypothetical protein n=1 Tax=Salegentibacter tibetensis TaxID=2873600 RepID=UPI001CCEAD7D|nr:hypothetical protein [Salegentibacter tibetensis]MBZ9729073.1 hypothetical protein [Salegentibacter tibetensis]
MLDENFVTTAYNSMERGFPEFRKRKKRLAGRSILKNFLYIFKVKLVRTDARTFLLHPKPEIKKIFSDAIDLDINKSSYLKIALFYVQLGYIAPSIGVRVWAARKGYEYLQCYFKSGNITILNCGPSILSPFLAKLCEDKNDNSKYYIIQHGLYQLDYKPYEFEFRVKASRSIVWSDFLAQNYISLGMLPEKVHVLPTYLFKEIKNLNTSNKVLIVGESLNKIDTDFDREYGEKVLQMVQYLKKNTMYNEFVFKKHPRALPSAQFDAALENNDVLFTNRINLKDYGLVIGAVSTLMIEAMAEGCRVLQLSLEKFSAIEVGNYSLYTSAENIQDVKEIKEKIDILNNLDKNYIKREYLRIDKDFEDCYKRLVS